MDANPAFDPGRFGHIPRRVKLQTQTVMFRAGVWLAALVVFVIVPICGALAMKRLHKFEDSGVVYPANVVGTHVGRGRSSASTMTVSFNYHGQQVTETRQPDELVMKRYWFSRTVPVTVLPGDKLDWELGLVNDEVIGREIHVWSFLDGLWGVIVGGFLVSLEICVAIERKLVATGSVVPGTVVSAKYIGTKTGSRVKYSFHTLSGTVEKTATAKGNVADEYPPGTGLAVFVLGDDNPSAKPFGFFQYVELADST